MESLWNIFQSRADSSVNIRYRTGIIATIPDELLPNYLAGVELSEDRFYFRPNVFSTLPLHVIQITSNNRLLDAIFWRSGIYVVIFLYLALFLIARREKMHLFVILPSGATLLTLVLVQGWQAYRYLWFFPLSVFVFIVYIFILWRNAPPPSGLKACLSNLYPTED
jgi:hypothetical protein